MLVALHLCANRFICYIYLLACLFINSCNLFINQKKFIICIYLLKVFICNVQVFVN